MTCPKCGNTDQFRSEVIVTMTMLHTPEEGWLPVRPSDDDIDAMVIEANTTFSPRNNVIVCVECGVELDSEMKEIVQ